ncbi:uncharacterized protein EV422DRAFT_224261 [Fimicolochytrium jonesii]|uniref:uncharacterized protein n=1 Tax=Fimicolochytrium jonesii TaxID=1396493 RepID=UPI0022FDE4B4|nr:uncharacterized protein EV422DRAFT_224261 [Fimicolochytrium jonesii]KAI8817417.1 hypothetical protein EV422DRAFT_224261 [Fimicolochytrium jonesii]
MTARIEKYSHPPSSSRRWTRRPSVEEAVIAVPQVALLHMFVIFGPALVAILHSLNYLRDRTITTISTAKHLLPAAFTSSSKSPTISPYTSPPRSSASGKRATLSPKRGSPAARLPAANNGRPRTPATAAPVSRVVQFSELPRPVFKTLTMVEGIWEWAVITTAGLIAALARVVGLKLRVKMDQRV